MDAYMVPYFCLIYGRVVQKTALKAYRVVALNSSSLRSIRSATKWAYLPVEARISFWLQDILVEVSICI